MNDLKILGGCIIKTNTVLETMLLRLEQEVAKPENGSVSLTTRKSLLDRLLKEFTPYVTDRIIGDVKAWLEGMKFNREVTEYNFENAVIDRLIQQLEQKSKTAHAGQGG